LLESCSDGAWGGYDQDLRLVRVPGEQVLVTKVIFNLDVVAWSCIFFLVSRMVTEWGIYIYSLHRSDHREGVFVSKDGVDGAKVRFGRSHLRLVGWDIRHVLPPFP
jgi:hypothetical protein